MTLQAPAPRICRCNALAASCPPSSSSSPLVAATTGAVRRGLMLGPRIYSIPTSPARTPRRRQMPHCLVPTAPSTWAELARQITSAPRALPAILPNRAAFAQRPANRTASAAVAPAGSVRGGHASPSATPDPPSTIAAPNMSAGWSRARRGVWLTATITRAFARRPSPAIRKAAYASTPKEGPWARRAGSASETAPARPTASASL